MAESTTSATRAPSDATYLGSIRDPFFKSVADQAIPPITGDDSSSSSLKPAQTRLDSLEIVVRKKLLQMMVEHRQGDVSEEEIVNTVGSFWKSALELCHHLVYQSSQAEKISDPRYEGMNARRLPILLISDCIDGLPSLDATQKFWKDFVEPALDNVLFGDLFWNDPKTVCHLPLLKVCNQFLRALERSAEDTLEWKGRILWDLAKGFAVADRSSLKLWGSFHTDNTTHYETQTEFEGQSSSPLVPSAAVASSASSSSVDYNLYEAFWSLQSDFSNPNHIQVGDFIKKLRLVLTALESAASNKSNMPVALPQGEPTSISKKYLTSSALLPSQMASPSFRCSVATQFLIVAWHLSAESPPLKNALSSFLTRARKLIQNDDPELHDLVWNGILSSGREDHWRQWKKQKCPAKPFEPQFKGHTNNDGSPKRQKPRLLDGPLGGPEGKSEPIEENYEFLTMDDLKRISKEHMEKLPRLEKHLEPYVEALDPEAGIEDEYHPKNDSMFTWQAMRLYSRQQLSLLRNCRRPDDLERITRLWYRSRGEEIPGEIPPESKAIDEEEEDDDSMERNDTNYDGNEDVDRKEDSQQDTKMDHVKEEEEQRGVQEDAESQENQSQLSQLQPQPVLEDEMEVDVTAGVDDSDGDRNDSQKDATKEETIDAEMPNIEGHDDEVAIPKDAVEEDASKEKEDAKPNDTKQDATETRSAVDKGAQADEKIIKPAPKSAETNRPKPQDNQRKDGKDKPSPRNALTQRDGGKSDSQPWDGRRSNEGGRNRHNPRDDRRNWNEPSQQSRGRGGDGRPDGRHDKDYRGGSGGRHPGDRFGGGSGRGGPDRGGPDQGGNERGGPDRGGPDRGGPDRGGPDKGGPRGGRGDGRRGGGGDGRPYRRRRL